MTLDESVHLAPTKRTAGLLLLASFLSLYVELALIRWIPATVHIVGFFTNLVLIGSFLGLGIGFTRPTERFRAAWQTLFRLAVVVGTFSLMSLARVNVILPRQGDYGVNDVGAGPGLQIPLPLLLTFVFSLVAWAAIPMGRLVAGFFDRFDTLRAYSINIAGSILGVAGFALLSWWQLPPIAWFGLAGLALALLAARIPTVLPIAVIAVSLIRVAAHDAGPLRFDVSWSPYYKVVTQPIDRVTRNLDEGFVTDVNGQFLLSGLDLRPGAVLPRGVDPYVATSVKDLRAYYDLPFALHPPRRVLVLGAGAGNDVAAALRHGAQHVTAVEIDPQVLALGKRHHPEHPFASPNVRLVLDDARAFLNLSKDRFDLIAFATLDAHGLLSGSGNLRLDSYIYTMESLRAARNHLSAGGVVALSFGPFREDTQYRQYGMVRAVFGQDPVYLEFENGHRTILAGAIEEPRMLPGGWRKIPREEIAEGFRRYPYAQIKATDDWPHLYVRERRIPREYLTVLLGMLLVSGALVRRSFRNASALNGHFFFLGAGFLLMESKSVTEFALLVGSTWRTNVFVFIVILAMILAANLFLAARRRPPPVPILYVALFAGLIATYVWPIRTFATRPGFEAIAIAAAYLGVPISLAAMIFATSFRAVRIGSAALASNLIGAVVGGIIEYQSLAWGNRSLSLVALAMYTASFGFWIRQRSPGRPPRARRVLVSRSAFRDRHTWT